MLLEKGKSRCFPGGRHSDRQEAGAQIVPPAVGISDSAGANIRLNPSQFFGAVENALLSQPAHRRHILSSPCVAGNAYELPRSLVKHFPMSFNLLIASNRPFHILQDQ